MSIRASVLFLLTSSIAIMACSGSSGGGGEGGSGGGGGLSVPEGPPGTVGSPCKPGDECNPDLQCNQYKYCQPTATDLPSEIVQAVPPPDSVHVPASSPVFLFTTGTFSNMSFKAETYTQAAGKKDVTADIVTNKLTTSKGKDVFVLTSKTPFPLGASVVITMSGDFSGTLTFNVDVATEPSADSQLGIEAAGDPGCPYEALPQGWKGFGDTARIPATGSMKPSQGSKMLALSSGAAVCGEAIGGTTSVAVSGPIAVGSGGVTFDYNFQSSEFDDYCNSEYDDTFLAVLSGPQGAVAKIVNSVNMVCAGGAQVVGTFPGQPDGGDADYKETGKQSFTVTGGVGSPANLTFVVTDVGDSILSTVVGIDNIVVGN